MNDPDEDDRRYLVVLNDEDQYSIWLAERDVPDGWRAEGTSGTKGACLAHIEEVWVDMRPRSLREAMEARENSDGGKQGCQDS